MSRYLRIYKALLRINFIKLVTYRMNFINSMISASLWSIFSILIIVVLTTKISSAFGWNRAELILLTAVYSLIMGVFQAFFSHNFERIARIMMHGQFDPILLKPLDSQFSVSLWLFNYSSLIRLVIGVTLLVYLIVFNGYVISIGAFITYLILSGFAVMIIYSIWLFVATFLIWVPEISNVIEMLYSVSGVGRYPPEMFKKLSLYLFFVVSPLVIISAYPLRALIGKGSVFEAFILISVCAAFFIGTRLFWRYALRSYTSASS